MERPPSRQRPPPEALHLFERGGEGMNCDADDELERAASQRRPATAAPMGASAGGAALHRKRNPPAVQSDLHPDTPTLIIKPWTINPKP
mmetsp:Transcript_27225/g.43600  ORF Transcript_27225/g.43600 Transcript_27225/m.43600 type:complete len:89 (-) Transcript_27225:54-320(-)